uniref:Putative secreted protein n=1 Tax=Ixodes ricinus TaxID=34613 RepID=A0A6B0U8N1_IXORI
MRRFSLLAAALPAVAGVADATSGVGTAGRSALVEGFQERLMAALNDGGTWNRSRMRMLMLDVVLRAATFSLFSSVFSSVGLFPCRAVRSFLM